VPDTSCEGVGVAAGGEPAVEAVVAFVDVVSRRERSAERTGSVSMDSGEMVSDRDKGCGVD